MGRSTAVTRDNGCDDGDNGDDDDDGCDDGDDDDDGCDGGDDGDDGGDGKFRPLERPRMGAVRGSMMRNLGTFLSNRLLFLHELLPTCPLLLCCGSSSCSILGLWLILTKRRRIMDNSIEGSGN